MSCLRVIRTDWSWRQQSIREFAVRTSPFVHRPSPSTKSNLRPLVVEKRWPGRPRKKPWQSDDWRELGNDAVENERYSSIRVWESYESSVVNHFADKPREEPIHPKKFQATYTAEWNFEVREFALINSEYSYQQVADAFKMPKTTVFDIINQDPSGRPAKGRGGHIVMILSWEDFTWHHHIMGRFFTHDLIMGTLYDTCKTVPAWNKRVYIYSGKILRKNFDLT